MDFNIFKHGSFYKSYLAQNKDEKVLLQQLIRGIANCLIFIHSMGLVHGKLQASDIDIQWGASDTAIAASISSRSVGGASSQQ